MKGLAIFWFPEIALAAFIASLLFEFADYSNDNFFIGIAVLPLAVARTFIYVFFGVYWINATRALANNKKQAWRFLCLSISSVSLAIGAIEWTQSQLILSNESYSPEFQDVLREYSFQKQDIWLHRLKSGEIFMMEMLYFSLLIGYSTIIGKITRMSRWKELLSLIFYLTSAFLLPFYFDLVNWDHDLIVLGISAGSISFQFIPFFEYFGAVSTFLICICAYAFRLAAGRIIIEPKQRSPYYSPPTSEAPSDSTQ